MKHAGEVKSFVKQDGDRVAMKGNSACGGENQVVAGVSIVPPEERETEGGGQITAPTTIDELVAQVLHAFVMSLEAFGEGEEGGVRPKRATLTTMATTPPTASTMTLRATAQRSGSAARTTRCRRRRGAWDATMTSRRRRRRGAWDTTPPTTLT